MPTEDFVKYMTRAKGAFLSKYNIPISNIQLVKDNDEIIEFEIEGMAQNGEKPKKVIVSIEK